MRRSKTSAVILGALVAAAAIGGTIALESGCTVLTNDALPDDAGLFEAGDAAVEPCNVCLALQCRAPQALCLTNEACASVLTCGGDPDAGADAAAASIAACACSANADGGASLERLYHAYTSCNDARLTACATDCASQNRVPSTLPACSTPDDGGAPDAGDAAADASSADAGDLDGGAPDAETTDALTDFALEEPANAALRAAWLADAAVVTPHPRAHALYADKRNLVALSDDALLAGWGVDAETRAILANKIPRTELVLAGNADDLWARRKQLFFKPAAGYGSKAAYRGDKVTKRVFEEILAGNYIAQALVPPSSRTLQVDATPVELKLDLRNYVYAGHVQLIAARLWQGQTTNFRTPGGGFAPVLTVPAA